MVDFLLLALVLVVLVLLVLVSLFLSVVAVVVVVATFRSPSSLRFLAALCPWYEENLDPETTTSVSFSTEPCALPFPSLLLIVLLPSISLSVVLLELFLLFYSSLRSWLLLWRGRRLLWARSPSRVLSCVLMWFCNSLVLC